MIKHLWTVTYKMTYNTSTFQVITEEKDLNQVVQSSEVYFRDLNSNTNDIVGAEYIGNVYEGEFN